MMTRKDATPMMHDDELIVAIFYHKRSGKWRPDSVLTDSGNCRNEYDFDWLKKNRRLVFHNSGGGPKYSALIIYGAASAEITCLVWYDHSQFTLAHDGSSITDHDAAQFGYRILKAPRANPFDEADETDGHTEWCQICRSLFENDSTCHHLHYQDGSGMVLGCGASDCDLTETRRSLWRLLDALPELAVRKLLQSLMSGKFHISRCDSMLGGHLTIDFNPEWVSFSAEQLGAELDYERYWPGLAWLYSLDKTGAPTSMTAGWVYEWLHRASQITHTETIYSELTADAIASWMALAPDKPSELRDLTFDYVIPSNPRNASDVNLLKNPSSVEHLVLEGPSKTGLSVKLSIAKIKQTAKSTFTLKFGRILEQGDKHTPITISMLD